MKKFSRFILTILFLAVGSLVSIAAEEQAKSDQDPMMAQWMKNAAPGDAHKVLDAFIGKWNHTVRWWMAPDAPPQESKGSNVNSWIMGGRYLQQVVNGQAMNQPFEGMGIIGYDNLRTEYVSIWIDNMGTGIMISTAQYEPETMTFMEKGSLADPMTGEKNRNFRGAWSIVDQNHFTYELFLTGPDGKEFKSMEIAYTREAA